MISWESGFRQNANNPQIVDIIHAEGSIVKWSPSKLTGRIDNKVFTCLKKPKDHPAPRNKAAGKPRSGTWRSLLAGIMYQFQQ